MKQVTLNLEVEIIQLKQLLKIVHYSLKCITKIDGATVDDADDLDMPMYNL